MNPSYSVSGKLNYSYQSAYEDVQSRMSDERERDEWKRIAGAARERNAQLEEENRRLQRRDDYVSGCLV